MIHWTDIYCACRVGQGCAERGPSAVGHLSALEELLMGRQACAAPEVAVAVLCVRVCVCVRAAPVQGRGERPGLSTGYREADGGAVGRINSLTSTVSGGSFQL